MHAEDVFKTHGWHPADAPTPTPADLKEWGLTQDDLADMDDLSDVWGDCIFFSSPNGKLMGSYSMDEGTWSITQNGKAIGDGSISDDSLAKWMDQYSAGSTSSPQRKRTRNPRMGGLHIAEPLDVENPGANFVEGLHPFEKNDWYGWAGAERFSDGSEPLIGEVEVSGWPEEDFEGGKPLGNATIIVDAQGVSINGVNGAYAEWTRGDKEQMIAKAKQVMSQQPIDVNKLKAEGWEEINMPSEPYEQPQVPIEAADKTAGPLNVEDPEKSFKDSKIPDFTRKLEEYGWKRIPEVEEEEDRQSGLQMWGPSTPENFGAYVTDDTVSFVTDGYPNGTAHSAMELGAMLSRFGYHGGLPTPPKDQEPGQVGPRVPSGSDAAHRHALGSAKKADESEGSYDAFTPKSPADQGRVDKNLKGEQNAELEASSTVRAEYYPGNDFVRLYQWDGQHVGDKIVDMPKAEFQKAKQRGEYKYTGRDSVHSSTVYIYYKTGAAKAAALPTGINPNRKREQDEMAQEHPGAVCGQCGRTVTNGEYSYGGSNCCKADVVAEEQFGQSFASKKNAAPGAMSDDVDPQQIADINQQTEEDEVQGIGRGRSPGQGTPRGAGGSEPSG